MDKSIIKYMAFIKTVECGSFTTASEVLHYSQSGISRMISDLEQEWHVTLLERSRVGVRLTSDGMKLLPYAQSVCAEYAKLQMQVDDLNGLHAGLLRIGTISSIATHWLPNIIAAFQQPYPNIDFELLLGHYADIEGWIAEGRVDCGFLRLPTAQRLDTTFLQSDRLLVVLPQTHPLAQVERFPVEALMNDPFILLEKDEKADISAYLEAQHIAPRVRIATIDDYAVMSMVEKGLGISILPELILRRIPYRIVAKELSIPAYRTLGFAVRDRQTVSLAVKRFTQFLDRREENPPIC